LQLRLLKETNRILDKENYELRERVKELLSIITDDTVMLPPEWGFSGSQRTLILLLYRNKTLTPERFMLVNDYQRSTETDPKVVRTQLSYIRRKLKDNKIPINIISASGGYMYMDEPSKLYLRSILEE
jgi:hypothetical protein